MFAIADEREDGRSYWWCGGLIWLANVDEAAKFETYEYARHTIEFSVALPARRRHRGWRVL
jgi:hypothetical protein